MNNIFNPLENKNLKKIKTKKCTQIMQLTTTYRVQKLSFLKKNIIFA